MNLKKLESENYPYGVNIIATEEVIGQDMLASFDGWQGWRAWPRLHRESEEKTIAKTRSEMEDLLSSWKWDWQTK